MPKASFHWKRRIVVPSAIGSDLPAVANAAVLIA
jgi:hypothetical protein